MTVGEMKELSAIASRQYKRQTLSPQSLFAEVYPILLYFKNVGLTRMAVDVCLSHGRSGRNKSDLPLG